MFTIVIGPRCSGKTNVMKTMIQSMTTKQNYKKGYCCYGNEISQSELWHLFEPQNHTEIIDLEKLRHAMDLQRNKDTQESNADMVPIVFDACFTDRHDDILKQELLRDLFMHYQHYNIFLILSLNYVQDLPKQYWNQASHVVVMQNDEYQISTLYKTLELKFLSLHDLEAFLQTCGDTRFGCALVDVKQSTIEQYHHEKQPYVHAKQDNEKEFMESLQKQIFSKQLSKLFL